MSLNRKIGAAAVSLIFLAGVSDAQEERFSRFVGDESLGINDMTSGGRPETVVISGLSSIEDYAFDGSDLSIPFTLEGTQSGSATVWLIIYTKGLNPPLTHHWGRTGTARSRRLRRSGLARLPGRGPAGLQVFRGTFRLRRQHHSLERP